MSRCVCARERAQLCLGECVCVLVRVDLCECVIQMGSAKILVGVVVSISVIVFCHL